MLFNVTINDILVIYVTAHRCAGGLKKLDLRSGSQHYRHFAGFFNMPVQAPTRDQPFYTVIPTHRPNSSPFTTRWGYGGQILDLTPRALTGNSKMKKFLSTEGFEPGTFHLRSEHAKRWAIRADKYRSHKGDLVLPELFMLIACTSWSMQQ